MKDVALERARAIYAKAEARHEAHNRAEFCIQNGICPDCGEDLKYSWQELKKNWLMPWKPARLVWVNSLGHISPWAEMRCSNGHSHIQFYG
jgi:hypothetical protein